MIRPPRKASEPPAHSRGRSFSSWIAIGVTLIAGACASNAPPGNANERVYRSQALEEAKVHAQGWRFLPLQPGQEASQREFDRTADGCLKLDGADAIRFCMTQRGFYPTACNDGIDNDRDGLTDHPDDPGCAAPDSIEEDPACDDGRDNDGDGFVDWDGGGVAHEDPECEDGSQAWERQPERFFGR